MKTITLISLLLLTFTTCVDDFPIDNDVMVLTDDTFDEALKNQNLNNNQTKTAQKTDFQRRITG